MEKRERRESSSSLMTYLQSRCDDFRSLAGAASSTHTILPSTYNMTKASHKSNDFSIFGAEEKQNNNNNCCCSFVVVFCFFICQTIIKLSLCREESCAHFHFTHQIFTVGYATYGREHFTVVKDGMDFFSLFF